MIRKIAAIYSIFMGLSMLGMWTMFYFTGGIPELHSKPVEIVMHLTAELATALALVVGGYGLITLKKWGYQIYLLATGALIYTLIQSPGYYLQKGVVGFVVMFGVFILLAIIILVLSLNKKEEFTLK